jgi:hypothetical protein
MLASCYEVRDYTGQYICGYHQEALIERVIPSQTQGKPIVVLECPVSRQQFKVV